MVGLNRLLFAALVAYPMTLRLLFEKIGSECCLKNKILTFGAVKAQFHDSFPNMYSRFCVFPCEREIWICLRNSSLLFVTTLDEFFSFSGMLYIDEWKNHELQAQICLKCLISWYCLNIFEPYSLSLIQQWSILI